MWLHLIALNKLSTERTDGRAPQHDAKNQKIGLWENLLTLYGSVWHTRLRINK